MEKAKAPLLRINFWFGYFVLILFLAVRSEHPFVDEMAFNGLSLICAVLLIVDICVSFVFLKINMYRRMAIIGLLIYKTLIFILCGVIFYFAFSYLKYYAIEFLIFLAATLPALFLINLAVSRHKNAVIGVVLSCVIIMGGILAFVKTAPSGFKTGAVVYAVGDEYQIVWSTYNRGVSYVEIGGKRYYDSEGGSARTDMTVHKVSVPVSVLDAAKAYTVHTRNMIYRNAYGALQGKTISRSYSFRPIDESDGIQFFAASDIHDYKTAAVKAASYYGDKLDFLILAGDISSFIPRQHALDFINKVASDITGGTRPVIYARGNHETRGNASGDLHRYVGANGTNYYYSFRFGSLWGIVLDMAEDKEDADWEYYGAADYESYREKQLAYLDTLLDSADLEYNAPGVRYRIAVSHITTAFTDDERAFADVYQAFNERLNAMNIDIMISGHRHSLMFLDGGHAVGEEHYYDTAYNNNEQDKPDIVTLGADFAAALVSCHSDTQIYTKAAPFTSKFTGGAFEYKDGALTLTYINSQKAPVPVISPWFPIDYGKTVTVKTFS
ncbi:MAG: metallophosphoesterase family protein [Christensenellales bacterium]|jgi:hypothetical protein